MIDFIESGKSVYIEGVDFAMNHVSTPLFPLFGCEYIDDGNEENVYYLDGVSDTITDGISMDYQYGSDSDYMVDVVGGDEGTMILQCQDGLGRVVAYDGDNQYHTICSAVMMGSIIDGDGLNTKANLMNAYLTFLTQPLVSATDPVVAVAHLTGNYPNPFNPETTISFHVTESSENVILTVYNMVGQEVKQLVNEMLPLGDHTVVWNGKDNLERVVSSGVYFCRMSSGAFSETRKMVLMK